MKRIAVSLSLGLILLTSSALVRGQGLDVNDVSFLLPLNDHGPFPAFSLQELPGLSDDNFKRVLTFEHPETNPEQLPYTDTRFMLARQNWRLTSWRFDPCGEEFHFSQIIEDNQALVADEGNACRPRLRLVFQPLSIFQQPLASALHFLYALDDAHAMELALRLKSLRDLSAHINAPTLRLPLIVHPALIREMDADQRPFSTSMLETINATASGGHLEFITFAVRETVNHWRFVGGTIRDGVWTRFVTRFSLEFYNWANSPLQVGVEDITCDQLSVCSIKPESASSATPEAQTLNEIFAPAERDQQIPGQRSLAIRRKAEVIDDARQTNFFNTNCISCHQSSNLRDRTSLLLNDSTALTGPTPFVPKRFVTDRTNGVINFGYFGTIPRISSRTAAESVVAAERVNQLLGLHFTGATLPQLETFWTCLMSQSNYPSCLTN